MATVTRYVNTNSTAGGDGTTNNTTGTTRAYASLSEWEADEQTDLVSDGDSHIVYCDGSGGDDTAMCDISGWTTGVSNTITILCSNGYRINTSSTEAIRFRTDYVIVEDSELVATGITAKAYSSASVTMKRSLIYSSSAGAAALSADGSPGVLDLENCLIVSPNYRAADIRAFSSSTLNHCGLYGGGTLGLVADSSATVTNTWAMGFSSQCFWTGGSAPSGSNNASSDATADDDYSASTGTVSLTAADEFLTPSSTLDAWDFSLKSASNLVDAGTGSLSEDMTGATRDGSPDIGPYEYISAGGSTYAHNPFGHPFKGPFAGPIS